jgi:hypothetical protein
MVFSNVCRESVTRIDHEPWNDLIIVSGLVISFQTKPQTDAAP